MNWLPTTPEGVTWAVGLIAFTGGLVGAVLGVASTHWNTSRHLDRQARDSRRELYADFVTAAVNFSRYASDRSEERRAALHLAAQRLEVIGHPDVHTAALDVLDTMLFMEEIVDDPADTHARSSWYGAALETFVTLARSETRTTGSASWKRALAETRAQRHGVDGFLLGQIAGRGRRWSRSHE